MVNWKWVAFWATLFLVFYAFPTEGQDQDKPLTGKPIVLHVPKVAVTSTHEGRTTIKVEWRIARHPDNRQWAFSYYSEEGDKGSSQGSMSGGGSPVTYPICTMQNERPCFREVSPGLYHFSACVYRVTDEKVVSFCDRRTLQVGGGG